HRDTVFLREHYEDVPRNIPHAQQVVIPVSAHLVQLERPDAVNRAIRRFIEPKAKESNSESRIRPTQLSVHAVRHAEMPWLQYYSIRNCFLWHTQGWRGSCSGKSAFERGRDCIPASAFRCTDSSNSILIPCYG